MALTTSYGTHHEPSLARRMVDMPNLSYILIWTSTFIGGFGVVLFFLAAMFVNHANGWLLILFAAPVVVFICVIGLIVGLFLRNNEPPK